jgi:glycosyltransferase involved in cell wall biosynthesis
MHILWLKTELLHPVDKGGKIRTYHMLKELKRNHRITYLAFDEGNAAPDARQRAAEYCHEVVCVPHCTRPKFSPGFYLDLASNLVTPLPYFIKKYQSSRMGRDIRAQVARLKPDVLVCDFLVSSVNVPPGLSCATVLFQHNVEAMIWKRHYEVQTNPLKKLYLYSQWRKTRAYERAACHRFTKVVAVSREDREMMEREYGVKAVADVPTGVDTEFFRPRGTETEEMHNLVFTGSMDWLPNEDAIRFFTEQIMPRVKQAVPGVTLTVVGRNPSPSLIELSRRDSSVIVTGRVEDVRPYIERAAAYIVPIRVGGGTRLKIYEALAMEKAMVSTTVGAEGLPVRHGEDLLIADTPEDFAAAVVRVLTDRGFARRLGRHAAAAVRERFGWDRVAGEFARVCESALRDHARRVKSFELEESLRQTI